MQSREEAAEARAAGEESGAQRTELGRLQERASQLQGYELGTLDHAQLMALVAQQMQARGAGGPCIRGKGLQGACVNSSSSSTFIFPYLLAVSGMPFGGHVRACISWLTHARTSNEKLARAVSLLGLSAHGFASIGTGSCMSGCGGVTLTLTLRRWSARASPCSCAAWQPPPLPARARAAQPAAALIPAAAARALPRVPTSVAPRVCAKRMQLADFAVCIAKPSPVPWAPTSVAPRGVTSTMQLVVHCVHWQIPRFC